MAVRNYIGKPVPMDPSDVGNAGSAWFHEWTGLLNGDVGQPLWAAHLSDKVIQFSGALGTGGVIKFRGCCLWTPNADIVTNWFDLTDPQGNAISKNAFPNGEQVEEGPVLWVAPIVTAGDGATNFTATMNSNAWRR